MAHTPRRFCPSCFSGRANYEEDLRDVRRWEQNIVTFLQQAKCTKLKHLVLADQHMDQCVCYVFFAFFRFFGGLFLGGFFFLVFLGLLLFVFVANSYGALLQEFSWPTVHVWTKFSGCLIELLRTHAPKVCGCCTTPPLWLSKSRWTDFSRTHPHLSRFGCPNVIFIDPPAPVGNLSKSVFFLVCFFFFFWSPHLFFFWSSGARC